MKTIQTRLFKLDGIWQLGFAGLRGDDIQRLTELRGFRYCDLAGMWHISFHVNTTTYLNRKYEGWYHFRQDDTSKEHTKTYVSSQVEPQIRMMRRGSDERLVLRHTYHRALYGSLRRLEGSWWDRAEKEWLIPGFHQGKVGELAELYGFRIIMIDEAPGAGPVSVVPQAGERDQEDRERTEAYLRSFEKELRLRNMSNRTTASYVDAMRQFLLQFGGCDLQEVTHAEIRDYLDRLMRVKSYSYSTLNIHISAIKAFYDRIFNMDIQQFHIPRPKSEKRLPKVLSKEEIRSMAASCRNIKHRVIVLTLYSTAIRRNELISIRLTDLDLGARQIHIHGKGNKDRIVYFGNKLHDHLKAYLAAAKPKEYLFEGQGGGRYSETSVGKVVKAAAARAGIDRTVTPHMLRHSLATHYITSGISVAHVQKLLGHSSVKTTMIYTHITDNDLRNLRNPIEDMDI